MPMVDTEPDRKAPRRRSRPRSPGRADTGALELLTRSPEETQTLGIRIGRELHPPDVVMLHGALGSGKTTLARGMARGLGVADSSVVCSPSFALVNTYDGWCPVYHVDLYRLGDRRDYETVGVDEFIGTRGVTIVEWGERLPVPLKPSVAVYLQDAGENCRMLRVEAARRFLRLLKMTES